MTTFSELEPQEAKRVIRSAVWQGFLIGSLIMALIGAAVWLITWRLQESLKSPLERWQERRSLEAPQGPR